MPRVLHLGCQLALAPNSSAFPSHLHCNARFPPSHLAHHSLSMPESLLSCMHSSQLPSGIGEFITKENAALLPASTPASQLYGAALQTSDAAWQHERHEWVAGKLCTRLGHLHLWKAPAIDHARILHRLTQHAQRIVQAPLCLIQHMRACMVDDPLVSASLPVRQTGSGKCYTDIRRIFDDSESNAERRVGVSDEDVLQASIHEDHVISKAACQACRQAPALHSRTGWGLTGAAQNDGAGLAHLHPREVDELVLANHDLLYQLAAAKLHRLGLVKGGSDLAACKQVITLSGIGAQACALQQHRLWGHLACGVVVHNLNCNSAVLAEAVLAASMMLRQDGKLLGREVSLIPVYTQPQAKQQVPTCDKRQALDAIKVCMLNGHDACVCKDLLGEVIDELPIDEAVDAVADDGLYLGPHLVSLCLLYVCYLHRCQPVQRGRRLSMTL